MDAPQTLAVEEVEDAHKYAICARLAYEDPLNPQQHVLDQLRKFESAPGKKPFAKLKPSDVRLVHVTTKVFDPIPWLGGALETDTEALFIRVPGKGFDNDTLKGSGDQLIVAFRGTETTGPSLTADLATDLRSVQSPIQDMLGLPDGALDGETYQGMRVHRGFLTSFNDLMTGGTAREADKTMEYVASDLLGGKTPARVVCCGHSLGAALSTLGAFWWSKRHPEVEVFNYAFASPRVGNSQFTTDFLEGTGRSKQKETVATNQVDKSYRFTHKADLVPAVPPPVWILGGRYSHVERSVFLFEPQERTWGVKGAEQIQLAPGQTYAAALLHRPANYLLNRLLRPVSSTRAEYHSMDKHLNALGNIVFSNASSARAPATASSAAPATAKE